jgi:hypothetical protein
MILMSINIRGVGGSPKMPSLRRILSVYKLDILFLQETLVDEEKANIFLYSLYPSWMISTVSSVGSLGGLLAAWNPDVFDLQSHLCAGGILLTGIHLPDNRRISFLNAYGPYTGRRQFWELVESRGILDRG